MQTETLRKLAAQQAPTLETSKAGYPSAAKLANLEKKPAAAAEFQPLAEVTLPRVPTPQAAYYLNRKAQTLRNWACAENWPEGLRPIRINGRLAWPVDGIRAVLGMSA